MRTTFFFGALAGLAGWIIVLRRRLSAEQRRATMYQEIAARLDQRLSERGRGA